MKLKNILNESSQIVLQKAISAIEMVEKAISDGEFNKTQSKQLFKNIQSKMNKIASKLGSYEKDRLDDALTKLEIAVNKVK